MPTCIAAQLVNVIRYEGHGFEPQALVVAFFVAEYASYLLLLSGELAGGTLLPENGLILVMLPQNMVRLRSYYV